MVQWARPTFSNAPTQQQIDMAKEAQFQKEQSNFTDAMVARAKGKKGDAKTKRAQALQLLDTTSKLRNQGFDVTPDQVQSYLAGPQEAEGPGMIRKATDYLGITDEAPPEQQAAPVNISDLFGKRTAEYGAKAQRQKESDELRGLQLGEAQRKAEEATKPFEETREAQEFTFKDQRKQAKEDERLVREDRGRTIPGIGLLATKEDANAVKKSMAEAEDSVRLINEIKELGTNISPITDWKKTASLKQKMKVLAGKLRIPLTGPGVMTETEFQRLIEAMGDPSSMTSTEDIEKSKLDSLKETLADAVATKLRLAGAPEDAVEKYRGGISQIGEKQAPQQKPPTPEMDRASMLKELGE